MFAPKVSVCVVTYNQGPYIRQCLESVLEQRTSFDFEIVVRDDASTDDTPRIVEELAARHSTRIRVLAGDQNVGAAPNIYRVYQEARGEYIAHLDGDDYFCPGKLQAQVDVLDANPALAVCSHNMLTVDRDSRPLGQFNEVSQGERTLFDLYGALPFFAHSSKMFRRENLGPLAKPPGRDLIDIEVHVAQAKLGNIYHLSSALGAYRVDVGMSRKGSKVNPILPAAARRVFVAALADHPDRQDYLRACFAKVLLGYAYQSALLGDANGFKAYTRESLGVARISSVQLAMGALTFAPRVAISLSTVRRRYRDALQTRSFRAFSRST